MTGEVEFVIEDGRAALLPEDHDRATGLEYLGSWFTYRNLMPWANCDAHVIRYEDGSRSYVASVDDLLSGAVRAVPDAM